MVAETLQLGIHLLSGGNKDIQKVIFHFNVDIIDVLKERFNRLIYKSPLTYFNFKK